MYDYEFVPRSEVNELKNDLIDILHEVQDIVRPIFTFRYDFNVGSGAHNLVTRQVNGNKGFDLDCNIRVNDPKRKYTAYDIRHTLIDAFNKVGKEYGFDPCEDETRVFSIRVRDRNDSRILYGCDFAIVHDYVDEDGYKGQEYIHHSKGFYNTYEWEEQPEEYYTVIENLEYINGHRLKTELREEYLDLKCKYGPTKKSMFVYYEALNNVYMLDKAKRKK